MMKKAIALLLVFLLVGCSSSSWITISDAESYDGYSIYKDGKLVCESASSCSFKAPVGKEMLLELRKDDVVYAHVFATAEDESENGSVGHSDGYGMVSRTTADIGRSVHTPAGVMVFMIVGAPILIASGIGSIITKVNNVKAAERRNSVPAERPVLRVGTSDSTQVPFPWDKPAK